MTACKASKSIRRARSCFFVVLLTFFLSWGSPHSISAIDDQIDTIYVGAPVSIGNLGIQNLVIGISYQPVSDDDTLLKSRSFANFIKTIDIEIKGIAMSEILANPYITLDTLAELARSIQTKITDRIDQRIKETFPESMLTIPVSISKVEFTATEHSTVTIKRSDF